MGNLLNLEPEPVYQTTYKICMKCHELNNECNDKLTILNAFHDRTIIYGDGDIRKRLMLICSKGHIFNYEGNSRHIDFCINEIENKSKNEKEDLKKKNEELQNENEELKKENEELKKKIEELHHYS